MAILKQRLNRKNSSGSYDTIYLETCATVVKMSETDSTKLSDKISSMDTAIAGKQPAGSYAAASHSHNGANLSYDSTRSINDAINNNYSLIANANNEISSLKSSVSNGKSAVASAITDKGVSTSATASFNTMANNIRSITSISSPKLIPGNILWSIGTTDIYGNPEYSAYTPPIFAQDPNCIIVGHKILTGYNTITGRSSVTTGPYFYYFYNIITGNMYTIRPSSDYSYDASLTSNVKNGDPYLIILSCPNSTGYSHTVILLQ